MIPSSLDVSRSNTLVPLYDLRAHGRQYTRKTLHKDITSQDVRRPSQAQPSKTLSDAVVSSIFSSKRGAKTINLAECRGCRFVIELSRLRQVATISNPLRIELSVPHMPWRKGGESQSVNPSLSRISNACLLCANLQHRVLAWRSQNACDPSETRCRALFGVIGYRELAAALLRSLRLFKASGARLSAVPLTTGSDSFDCIPHFFRQRILDGDTLNDSCAVAKLRKGNLSA